jgi:lysophospholipase L1-like esterase
MSKGIAGALKRLALIVGGLLFGLLLAEIGFRLVKPLSTQANHRPLVYQPDPDIGYRYLPGSSDYIERYEYRQPVQINSGGFFDDEYPEVPPPGVTRIAAIGDSFTAGFQVGRGRNYPDVLEDVLNEAGLPDCPCEVLNFGLDGTGALQQVFILEKMALNYQPDIVVVTIHSTDLMDAGVGTVHRDLYRGYLLVYRRKAHRDTLEDEVDQLLEGGGRALSAGLQRSYLMRVLYNAWLKREGEPTPNLRDNRARANLSMRLTNEEALAALVKAAEQMESACQEAGCQVMFVILPSREDVNEQKVTSPFLEDISGALSRRGLRTVSLFESFSERAAQGEDLFFEYDGHFNRDGYQLMAEEIAAHLQQEGLLD